MAFIPSTPKSVSSVPYFEDVTSDAGWQGQTTRKSIDTLKAEIMSCIGRLGGLVTGFQHGWFDNREGFQLHYVIESFDGKMVPGRIDIAALPVRKDSSRVRSYQTRQEQSLKMALYMFRNALDGTWFLQQLSPGYSALMPFMLASKDKTVSQLWQESSVMKALLPPKESDFTEGSVEVIDERI